VTARARAVRGRRARLWGAGTRGRRGLFLRKRWAEWLTVVATTLLIPLELYELVRKPSALKGAGLIVNILIVLYLVRVVRRKGQHQANEHD